MRSSRKALRLIRFRIFLIAMAVCCLSPTQSDAGVGDGYYTEEPIFHPYPKVNNKKGWQIQNFGPVGIGIKLGYPGMTMTITNVEEGSPAAATGKLQKDQIIESINGVVLKDRDPRMILGDIITEAEAKDGRVALKIKDGETVVVQLPVMGDYSPTWPLMCEKSERIVRNLADRLAVGGEGKWGSILFLLSTGEDKDLNVVRHWVHDMKEIGGMPWAIGYLGIGIAEYYLRTGDRKAFALMQQGADLLRDRIYNGAWAGRGGAFTYQSGGHMNAAGVHCLTFLLLAKTCGVDVDEFTLQRSLRHFFRYSGRGSVPYGDYTPKPGYGDCNGKTGGLALAMAAAARLTPDGENSIYAKAMEVNAIKSYYGVGDYNVGHTGGGIGEIWKSGSMALMVEKRPKQYRQYMDTRRCLLELSRRYDGRMGIGGGSDANYDKALGEHNIPWGTYFALNYTLPRKHLHLYGAPLSQWSKNYPLPVRPWGTAADDDFNSPDPVPGALWSRSELLNEDIRQHTGYPAATQLNDTNVSNRVILSFFTHPEITHRFTAIGTLLKTKGDDWILKALRAKDARIRHLGVMALHERLGTWHRHNKKPESVTPEMMDEVENIIRKPEESWFVKMWAMGLLQHADVARLRRLKDVFAALLEHEEYWLQGGAINASTRLLSEPDSYKLLLPPVVHAIAGAREYPIITRAGEITKGLNDASPEIQAYALGLLTTAYSELPSQLMSERGIYEIPGGGSTKRASFGRVIGFSTAGEDFLNSQPKVTTAWKISGKDADLFVFNGTFARNPEFEGTWCFVEHKMFTTERDAMAFIKQRLEKGVVPALGTTKINYGFKVHEDGTFQPLRFSSRVYDVPARYSGNMIYSTFIDKAYRYKLFTIDGRQYAMVEEGFDTERDPNFTPQFKTYVKVSE
jgi:hypothetical protein